MTQESLSELPKGLRQMSHGARAGVLNMWRAKSSKPILGAIAVATIAAACGSTASSSSPSASSAVVGDPKSHTLHLAFLGDISAPPDPDVYYAAQALSIEDQTYDSLVQYKPNATSPQIVPDLATSWTVSPDGLTYTFHLRHGVTFHDGTPFTSAAIPADFKRESTLNQGPAYMVADVTSVDTPDPYTAIVHLAKPYNAFLDGLASPYGPRMISPTALTVNAGTDNAQKYLSTHDAGSGPYTLASVKPGQLYVLKAYPGYWGAKPFYTTIDIAVIPSISTQELELKNGQLTMILHGIPQRALASIKSTPGLGVHEFGTFEEYMAYINPHDGSLSSLPVRKALINAINKQQIVDAVWPGGATVANQMFPTGELSPSAAVQPYKYDPSALKALAPSLKGQPYLIQYESTSPSMQQMANLIQTQLAAVGVQAQAQGIPNSQIFGYAGQTLSSPAMILSENWPDAANPYTWSHIVMDPTGGISFTNCPVPAATAALQSGVEATTKTAADTYFAQAGSLYGDAACWDMIANRHDAMAAPSWMTGFAHQAAAPWTLLFQYLKPKS